MRIRGFVSVFLFFVRHGRLVVHLGHGRQLEKEIHELFSAMSLSVGEKQLFTGVIQSFLFIFIAFTAVSSLPQ
jgi:hypothetical protein